MSIENLIGELRGIIGDPAGDNQAFGDPELQRMLERTLDGVAAETATDADYDLDLAAADACELWAMRLKDEVDFSDGSRSFKDSQKPDTLLTLAARFRQRSSRGIGVGRLSDSDTNTTGGWWQ